MALFESILETIGDTPLLHLRKIEERFFLPYKLFGKLERFNPSGSIKDRAALYMVKKALDDKTLCPGVTLVEATSGNMGISLAMISSSFGIKCHLYMPSNASKERIKMMKAWGAEVYLTPAEEGMDGALKRAEEEVRSGKAVMLRQFENLENPHAHGMTSGPEILKDLNGEVAALVVGIGTGGTYEGLYHYFKVHSPETLFFAVEPDSSPLLSEGHSGPHLLQGLGANFVPSIVDKNDLKSIIKVRNEDAYEMTRLLAKTEGVFAGISSGASLYASLHLPLQTGNVVAIFPDNGERYLSTEGLYD